MCFMDFVFSYGDDIQTLQEKDLSKVYSKPIWSQMHNFLVLA